MFQIDMLDENYNVYGDAILNVPSIVYSDAWDQHGALQLSLPPSSFQATIDAAWFAIGDRFYENETPLSSDEDGTFKITGAAGSVLFDFIIVKETERLRGRLEERIRYLVQKYAMTGSQAITKLTLETDNGFMRGIDDTVERGQTLSEFLYTALNQRGFSFTIRLDRTTGNLVFKLLRSINRAYPSAGIDPVMMTTLDAIENASFKRSKYDYRNLAIVCDEAATPKTVEVDQSNGKPKRAMYVKGSTKQAADGVSKFVIGGYGAASTTPYLAVSSNGASFTAKTVALGGMVYKVLYKNGFYFVSGVEKFAYSEDAATFNLVSLPNSTIVDLAYIDGVLFLRDRFRRMFKTYDLSTMELIYDGSERYSIPALVGETLVSMVREPDDLVIPEYHQIHMLKSIDWSSFYTEQFDFETPVYGAIKCHAEGNGLHVFAGATPGASVARDLLFIITADEGVTWSYATKVMTGPVNGQAVVGIAFGNGRFVLVTDAAKVYRSTNGVDWELCGTSLTLTSDISICFDGALFHVFSDPGTLQHITSPDGDTWTTATISLATSHIVTSAFGESNETGNLVQDGLNALLKAAVVETVDGDIRAELAPVYETDYLLGDVLGCRDVARGIETSKRVTSVEFVHTETEDSVMPKLGTKFLSFRQIANR